MKAIQTEPFIDFIGLIKSIKGNCKRIIMYQKQFCCDTDFLLITRTHTHTILPFNLHGAYLLNDFHDFRFKTPGNVQ